jgi:hypothetical protein
MNPNYKRISCVPLDVSLRDEIGVSVDMERLDELPCIVQGLLEHKSEYADKITGIMNSYIYNIGDSARFGGGYIIDRISYRRRLREGLRAAADGVEANGKEEVGQRIEDGKEADVQDAGREADKGVDAKDAGIEAGREVNSKEAGV